jgi:glycosyltransferase involved in cell wall biosynthesis
VEDYGIDPAKVAVIPPGVDVRKFEPSAKREAVGPLRLLFVGGDFKRKGGYDLFRAVASLPGPVEVDVVTRDPSVNSPTSSEVRVHLGVEPNSEEMRALYRAADIFVLPTYGDGMPLVIAEAMASGLPVVSTGVGAIPELVESGRNGFIVEPGDVASLARALDRLVSDDALRDRMGRASRDIAEVQHDVLVNAHRVLDLLEWVSSPVR